MKGRLVRTLGDGAYDAGPQTFAWDGRDADGHEVPNGVYFALVRFPDTGVGMSRKITVLRQAGAIGVRHSTLCCKPRAV